MLWPIRSISRTRTGQAATSRFSSRASSRPLVEMWRPVLYRSVSGVTPWSRASRVP